MRVVATTHPRDVTTPSRQPHDTAHGHKEQVTHLMDAGRDGDGRNVRGAAVTGSCGLAGSEAFSGPSLDPLS